MKKSYTILAALLLTAITFAQAPEGFNYQAVVKDAAGDIMVSTTIGVQVQLRETSIAGSVIYTETHSPTTNANGVFNLIVGQGTSTDTFNTIDWANDLHFLEISMDITNGSAYVSVGTTQLMSVPYAVQAATAATATTLPNGIDQGYIEALEARIAALDTRLTALEPLPTANVGDLRAGGVVFWVDPADNTRGLVCALSDYATRVAWGCSGANLPSVPDVINFPPVGPGTEIGDGITNTNGILTDCPTAPAALAARSLGPEWFLPSAKALNEMILHRAIINATASTNGGANFTDNFYWSSTEADYGNAWLQNFANGYQLYYGKDYPFNVRAVRAF
jgi:hypothetical protein